MKVLAPFGDGRNGGFGVSKSQTLTRGIVGGGSPSPCGPRSVDPRIERIRDRGARQDHCSWERSVVEVSETPLRAGAPSPRRRKGEREHSGQRHRRDMGSTTQKRET